MKIVICQFGLFLLFGTVLIFWSEAQVGTLETVYIKPTYPDNASCGQHSPCHPLDYYFDNLMYVPDKGYILIFIKGKHMSTTNTSSDQVHFVNADYIKFVGNGSANEVIVEAANIEFSDAGTVLIESLTVIGGILDITPRTNVYLSKFNNFTIINCIFIGTSIKIEDMNVLVNNTNFLSSPSTAISLYSSTIFFSGNIKFKNNRGIKGGALALIGTKLFIDKDTAVFFENNTADEVGGALYVNMPQPSIFVLIPHCFYRLINFNYTDTIYYNLTFSGNSAVLSGDHVYGAGVKAQCIADYSGNYAILNMNIIYQLFLKVDPNSTMSAVSGDPSRVCICDSIGKPQCAHMSKIFVTGLKVFPGEPFTLFTVVVGGDLGTTTGNIYAQVYFSSVDGEGNDFSGDISVYPQIQAINTHSASKCVSTTYTLQPNDTTIDVPLHVKFHLTTEPIATDIINEYYNYSNIDFHCSIYNKTGFPTQLLLHTPIFISVTVLPCPPGFFFVRGSSRCDCHPVLINSGATCELDNEGEVGLITWDTDVWLWISVDDNTTELKISNTTELSISDNCPADLCRVGKKTITYLDQESQCSQNRIGRLCGQCKESYSLAIGSSNCLDCSLTNNSHLSLLIFFAAAGPLLIILISVLNLTVTQGMINGLIVYANIIWAYQDFFFPQKITGVLTFLKVFIAWLNLDFGIEVCFFDGLNTYVKTWLQYTFPFYTAGLFFIGVRYSSKLSRLCGSRSVPTLATLLFLSYTKLLRTVIASLRLASIAQYYEEFNDTKIQMVFVWALDGTFTYGSHPHIYLLLAAIACLIFLWIPYTLLLLFMQWLRKADHHKPLRLIAKYKPVYDAYFAPLKDKHHYWFGVLLLAQGTLLVVSSLTLNIFPSFSIFLLLFIVQFMLWYMNYKRVYKTKSVTILESSFFINLVLLISGILYCKGNDHACSIIVQISVGFAFLKFLIIVLWNVIFTFRQSSCCRYVVRRGYNNLQEVEEHVLPEQHHQPPVASENAQYRDSILDERHPIAKKNEDTY